ncbi:MAG: hypothetical protein IH964_02035, partial [Candidatus Dadabacteria bacterium]|nr:hypothetical protein [Candidatus Dadabacteria bacterium]
MNKVCKAIEGFIWFNIYLIEVVIKTLTFTLVPFGVLGYILALIFKSLAIDVWNILFIATFILTLSIITIKDLKDKELRSREKYNSAKYLFLKYVPYLILLPAIIPLLNSTWLQLSRHGAFHIGYINQILNGVALPENVVLPGFP